MDIKEQAILISGASSGIGRDCAFRIAKAGFKVIAGVRSEKDAHELEKEASGRLKATFLDVTNRSTFKSAIRMAALENLYGIVNNAGIAVLGPLEFIPIEEVRRQFEVNLFGHIALTQALLPYLRRSGKGRIINMSSISSFIAFPFFGPYAASKSALEAFNDSLRRELNPWNIQVISIRPGNVSTSIWYKSLHTANAISDNFPSEARAYYKKRFMNPESTIVKMTHPSVVSNTVLNALTAKRPKPHYLVGMDARKYSILKWLLPDRLMDRII